MTGYEKTEKKKSLDRGHPKKMVRKTKKKQML